MRIYSASSEEALRTRRLLKDWAGEGFISDEQYERLEQETDCDLRTTNIFLRLVLFFFSLICVAAATALFFTVFLSRPSDETMGVFFLIFAVACYAGAEFAVSGWRVYRYGIEEALAVCSVAFLCVGIGGTFFSGGLYSSKPNAAEFVIPVVGALSSLWIWRRFGLWYAFLAAMVFAVSLPVYWTSSHSAQHVIVALLYAVGLGGLIALRSSDGCGLAEALLWLGIYLAMNLQLSSLDMRLQRWGIRSTASQFPTAFYWTTWVLIWCLPPIVLVRGVRQKDRFVIAVGGIAAILTFLSNKPYLGLARHTWDPMILGVFLSGVSLFIRRWLVSAPDGIRHGFTAARLSGKDKHLLNASSTVLGLVTPQLITPAPQTKSGEFGFDGGTSGGGGASGEF